MMVPDLQAAIDRARDEAVTRLFAALVVNLEMRATEAAAADRFGDGLNAIIEAHNIATQAAKDVENG